MNSRGVGAVPTLPELASLKPIKSGLLPCPSTFQGSALPSAFMNSERRCSALEPERHGRSEVILVPLPKSKPSGLDEGVVADAFSKPDNTTSGRLWVI